MELFLTIVIWMLGLACGIVLIPIAIMATIFICLVAASLVVGLVALVIMGVINIGDWFIRTAGCR
jgi:hypothetical protein